MSMKDQIRAWYRDFLIEKILILLGDANRLSEENDQEELRIFWQASLRQILSCQQCLQPAQMYCRRCKKQFCELHYDVH